MGPNNAAGPSGVSSLRSRRLLWALGIALAVVVVLLVADFVLGRTVQSQAACQARDGLTVTVSPAPFPLTSALLTGSIGSADAFIPWSVVEERAAANSPDRPPILLRGDSGLVVAETSVGPLPVTATLRPEIDGAGVLDLSLVSLNVAGQDVPPSLAEEFGGAGGPLQANSILGGFAGDLPFEVQSLEVQSDGLAIGARVPLSVLTSPERSSVCGASAT